MREKQLIEYTSNGNGGGSILKKLSRAISLILCAAMLIGILPPRVRAVNHDDGTCTYPSKTIYILAAEKSITFQNRSYPIDILESNAKYLIVTSNSAGSNIPTLSLERNGLTSVNVTVKATDSESPAFL